MELHTLQLEDLTLERLATAKSVRATDGVISHVLWENPSNAEGSELFVLVSEVSPEYLEPLQRHIEALLAQVH
jgi:hypothetical protein